MFFKNVFFYYIIINNIFIFSVMAGGDYCARGARHELTAGAHKFAMRVSFDDSFPRATTRRRRHVH